MNWKRLRIAVGAIAVVIVVGTFVGYKIFESKLTVDLPDYPPIKKAVWLEQGWKPEQREWFHHTDQGTQTLNIPYEWFVALEQPRISVFGNVGRLSDPAYLDRYGFIQGATKGGENQLPIGFARGDTMRTFDGNTWLNPRTKEPMTGIGFTCAACHTARLTYRQTTMLIDGGPALTNLGKFRQGLGISILLTKLVPWRFERFAKNVLGEDASETDKKALRKDLDEVWDKLDVVRKLDKSVADSSIEEGFGRLDALNRIGNQVFGLDLGKNGREMNYAGTSAPVNFPYIWNTPWFDWVQYNASIEQPMVRNAGEALGVSAPVNLTDAKRVLFTSGVQVRQLHEMERQIAGQQPSEQDGFTGLNPPQWPQNLLGPIDPALATKGAALYATICSGCHQAPVGSRAFWTSKNWLPANKFDQRYLHVNVVKIETIGTDPAQAEDMAKRKVWVPPDLGITTDSFGFALGELVEKTVNYWYDSQKPPITGTERDAMNGYRENRIQAPIAYKARPLNGVWATPPFLHNGSVPNIYALLSPVAERPKTFYLGRREFDPVCLGYNLTAQTEGPSDPDPRCLAKGVDEDAGAFDGGFKLDTTIRGNRNTGHEFNDGPRGNGIIGRKLAPEERFAIMEFLKSDCAISPKPGTESATSCTVLAYPEPSPQ